MAYEDRPPTFHDLAHYLESCESRPYHRKNRSAAFSGRSGFQRHDEPSWCEQPHQKCQYAAGLMGHNRSQTELHPWRYPFYQGGSPARAPRQMAMPWRCLQSLVDLRSDHSSSCSFILRADRTAPDADKLGRAAIKVKWQASPKTGHSDSLDFASCLHLVSQNRCAKLAWPPAASYNCPDAKFNFHIASRSSWRAGLLSAWHPTDLDQPEWRDYQSKSCDHCRRAGLGRCAAMPSPLEQRSCRCRD